MRVLHVLDHSIPLHSGYTFRTLSLLKAQRELGWDTFHITSPKHQAGQGKGATTAAEEDVDGWHFYRSAPPAPGGLPGLGELRLMKALEQRLQQVAEQIKPQVIHAHSPVLNALPALRVGKRLGIPVVYEVRAFWEDAAVDHGTTTEGSLRYRLTRAMETYALKRVDHVFTICEGLRADIVARGLPKSKVSVIPNAINLSDFELGKPADAELLAKWGLTGATVLGFIGSFYAYEGLDLLLAAFPKLLAARPELRVLLVGGGPQEQALKAQAQALGIADKVVFTGRVPHAEVNRYYDLVDLLVYPRHPMRLTELVTPLKPLEAMAQGHLLVASDVGGHRELIADGKTGHLFKAGDADALVTTVLRALAGREHWDAMRAEGRRFVETERNWTRSASGYIEPYKALLAGPRG
ncbi:glycosyltransferase, exosortase A system-associated [Paucibacter sp. APW11]|uniref:Glycosyltransferase, exosortase A system-associated n=1 Tax=Roseateles aquae TaxID=3077235 RepID=A0ABU3P5U5_9BURK|nr:TIGR04063 family PEP-CTERM/XrtA system glycosyltransferase [Paucibacter sp. APW11]MDT8997941.1 glycosyltransferase, exosortase A system-associated [Paucibacter sp. APW11]